MEELSLKESMTFSAFHAKDIVRKQAQQHMSHGPMTSILYFLGIPGPTQ